MHGIVSLTGSATPRRAEGRGTPLLLFLHIPKASGTTLTSIVRRQYPGDAVYRTADMAPRAIAEALGRDGPGAEQLQCVMGHMRFGLHRHLDRPARYITMLRHPVRRLVSHYEYVRRTREHYLHRTVVDGRITLDDYVMRGLSSELNDGQVRLLCGIDGAVTVPHGQVSEEMLHAARTNLREHFLAVGVTERFDESLLLLQALLGWRSVQYQPENRAPRRRARPPSAGTVELIMRYNNLDLQLYEDARAMLATALAAHGIDGMALTRFRARNVSYRARRFAARLLGGTGRDE